MILKCVHNLDTHHSQEIYIKFKGIKPLFWIIRIKSSLKLSRWIIIKWNWISKYLKSCKLRLNYWII